MSQRLTDTENALIGLAGGILEVTAFQSLNYFKNASQQGLPLTLNPSVLYRGYASNVANMGGCTMWQYSVAGKIKAAFTGGQMRPLTTGETIASGFLAGFSSGAGR